MNDPEVQERSYEIIKPMNPTPPYKSFLLSFIDQNFPPVHLPLLLTYTDCDSPTKWSDIMTTLKTSLSETLTQFYPLAGRCIGQTTVSCNDHGVPLIETDVDCRLDDVLNSPTKMDVLTKLLPPKDLFSFGQLPISEVLPLAFQINVFTCGGVVIGCYMLHKLLDGSSISTFLNYWADRAKNRGFDLIRPNLDAAATAFPPPSSNLDTIVENGDGGNPGIAMLWHRRSSIKVVAKSFIFNNAAIRKLKVDGSSEVVPTPTSFEAVVGFVWRHVMPSGPSVVSFSANIRNRTTPPLPRETMGNLIIGLCPSVDKRVQLTDLVKEIHNQVLKLEEKVESLKGENRVKAFLACRDTGRAPGDATFYNLSSWCKLGLDRVDFGFGKPSRIIPYGVVNPLLRNSVMLVDYSDVNGDGIEVWLFLEEKEMEVLESNSQFLAFASPA